MVHHLLIEKFESLDARKQVNTRKFQHQLFFRRETETTRNKHVVKPYNKINASKIISGCQINNIMQKIAWGIRLQS